MKTKNNFEQKRKITLRWSYAFIATVLVVMATFVFRILVLQNTDVDKIQKEYIDRNFKTVEINPVRGNLYASDGSILATTIIKYKVYLDFKIMKDTLYDNNIDALTDSLSHMFGKSKVYFRKKFDKQRKKGNQYYFLAGGLDYDKVRRLKTFPIFKLKQSKSGFMLDKTNYKRELATSKIGRGTIGLDQNGFQSGFEGAFSKYLKGTSGKQTVQRITSSNWKPIDYWNAIPPVDGQDVYVTLDLRIQDIAHTALLHQLKKFKAHHGTVVVIEVTTGKVKALVNLTKTEDGTYKDIRNHALKDRSEPGSIFKPVSLLAAMDDGFIDGNTTVVNNTKYWKYAGNNIEAHATGKVGISDILAKSCNVGTAKLITRNYGDKPQVFTDHLKKWKMDKKMDIELMGITSPRFITPKNPKWSRFDLASLSYGYSSSFNMLQLATFYNGVANGGKMLKPLFIEKIMKDGKLTYSAKPQVMVEKMASKEAIQTLVDALTQAVEKGTARSIFTPNLKMAGKTGTARFEYWKKDGKKKYQASFAGFYPSDKPLYTCLVSINQPDTSIGYFGSSVAAPVFKEIAGKTFLKRPQNIEKELLKERKVNLNKLIKKPSKINLKNQMMPNIVGLSGQSVIAQLENAGYRVDYKGAGKVLEQFPIPGKKLKSHQRIYLRLQN